MTDHTSKIGFDPLETRYPAQQIYEASGIAYYLAGSGAAAAWYESQAKTIHDSFAELARALGYRIERIEPADVVEDSLQHA